MIPGVLPAGVLWTLGGLYGLLAVATGALAWLRRLKPQGDFKELSLRVRSWWIMILVFTVALLFSRTVFIILFAFLSFLALKEYLSLIPTRRADRRVLFWAYLAIPVQYYWVATDWYGMFIIFVPVYLFLFLPLRMVSVGETRDFLRAVGTLHWGVMMLVFSLSHVAFLRVLPPPGSVPGGVGLVLYLVALTQLNDIAQYLWGKLWGRQPIVPTVSPNKTWAGFLGGVATTTALAWVAAPLTPLQGWAAVASGLLIGVGGFVGDVTISALKRDLGVKDTGSLLPGHGGILDRLDSLTFTAPLFLHFIRYIHY